MNRVETLEKLSKLSGVSSIQYTPTTPEVSIAKEGSSTIRANDKIYELIPDATKALANRLGITEKISDNLSLKTLSSVTQELLSRSSTISLIKNGKSIVSVADPAKSFVIDPTALFDKIDAVAKKYDVIRAMIIPETYSATLEIALTEAKPVKKGDLVRGGAFIEFSALGIINPQISAYSTVLACTNGALSTEHFFEYKAAGGDFDAWFNSSFNGIVNVFDHVLESYKRMAETAIDAKDRASVLNFLLQEARLGKEVNRAVKAKAINEHIETAWDVFNLVTWATSHAEASPTRIIRGMKSISEFAKQSPHFGLCPVCYNIKEIEN